MDQQKKDATAAQISALLTQTSAAHREYEIAELDGENDVLWPRWYANYLLEHGILGLLGNNANITGELESLLVQADISQRKEAPGEKWEDYYGRFLVAKSLG